MNRFSMLCPSDAKPVAAVATVVAGFALVILIVVVVVGVVVAVAVAVVVVVVVGVPACRRSRAVGLIVSAGIPAVRPVCTCVCVCVCVCLSTAALRRCLLDGSWRESRPGLCPLGMYLASVACTELHPASTTQCSLHVFNFIQYGSNSSPFLPSFVLHLRFSLSTISLCIVARPVNWMMQGNVGSPLPRFS